MLLAVAFNEAPVLGYEPPQVITDLHAHLNNTKIIFNTQPTNITKKHQHYNYDLNSEIIFSNLSLNTKILIDQPEHPIILIIDGLKFNLNQANLVETNLDVDILLKNDVLLRQNSNLVPPEVDVKFTIEKLKLNLSVDTILALEQFGLRLAAKLNRTILQNLQPNATAETVQINETDKNSTEGQGQNIMMSKSVKFKDDLKEPSPKGEKVPGNLKPGKSTLMQHKQVLNPPQIKVGESRHQSSGRQLSTPIVDPMARSFINQNKSPFPAESERLQHDLLSGLARSLRGLNFYVQGRQKRPKKAENPTPPHLTITTWNP